MVPEPKHLDKLRRLDRVLAKRAHKSSLDRLDITSPTKSADNSSSPLPDTPNESVGMDFPSVKRSRTSSARSATPSTTAADFLEPLNRLVDNVTTIAPVEKAKDMEQLFGDQVAIFLRWLDQKDKYTSQLYIMSHMNDVIQNKSSK